MSSDDSQNGKIDEKPNDKMAHYNGPDRVQVHSDHVFRPHHLEKLCSALDNHNAIARKLTSTTAIGEDLCPIWSATRLTAAGLGGFVLCTTPLSMVLLGFQGATGTGAANL